MAIESQFESQSIDLEEETERALRVQSAAPVGSEIELTDASERFITQDDGDNDVSGGGGSDALVTSGGQDTLRGGSGEDVLFAGSGDDTLIGGAGSDELNGGTGADEFVVQASDFEEGPSLQADFITDFEVGVDTLRLLGFDSISEFDDLVFLPVETGLAIVLGEERFIVLEGINSVDDLDSQSFEFAPAAEGEPNPAPGPLYLTEANDRYITTSDADDVVFALGGDDVVVAAGGNDSIVGGDGFDVLFGGAGDDTLEGGALGDNLTGGAGSDLFRFTLSDFSSDQPVIADFIKDYEAGVDSIELVRFNFSSLDEVTALNVATGLALEVATNRYIVFEGISSKDDLDAADFVFVDGNEAPLITSVALANDTGADDGVSSDPAISGTVEDADGTVAGMEISVNGSEFQDVSEALDGAGGFELSQETLEMALGNALPDGALSVDILVRDDGGLFSEITPFQSTLDRTAEPLSEVGLAPSSDTGIAGDGITALRSVRLTGEGEPGGTVTDGVVSTLVGNNGIFVLDGVPVGVGDNQISLTQTDPAGNTSQTVLDVTGIQSAEGQPVLTWNDITLEAIADNAEGATGASRVLAMQSVAVYDVIAAIDDAPSFVSGIAGLEGANLAAAVAQASYAVLKYAFPAFEPELDAYLAESLEAIEEGSGQDAGIALGAAIAERVIAVRSEDGWDDFETLSGSSEAGEWRETGPLFEPAIDPQWATMVTWSLQSQDQFRAVAPPDLTSEAYADAVNEARELGAFDSEIRSDEQTEAARFWKDGRGTESTPGHWNSIATDFMKDEAIGSAEAARALAILNVSIADAMIAAWDTKYAYEFWRPEDAIRNADEDGNALTVSDPEWQPLMLAPAHPEYVSGHAAASGAAAEALTELFGEQEFTTESLGLTGVERSFESYWEAAQENADSRLWGGVHFDFSNDIGLQQGADVAKWALDAFNNREDLSGPTILLDVAIGYTSELPFTISGSVLDTLSGVENLSVTVDGPESDPETRSVTFDTEGSFSFELPADSVDGFYSLDFFAQDAAGNLSRTANSTIIVDTVDPTITLSSLTDGGLSGSAARLTGEIDGTGSPIVALAYQIDDGQTYNLAFNQTTGAFDSGLNLSNIDAGFHTVRLIASDAAGNSISQEIDLVLDEALPFVVTSVLPSDGTDEVGSTFRPEIHFSRSVDPDTLISDTFFLTDAAGTKLPANIRLGEDGLKAWLFPSEPMPGSNTISLTMLGDQIKALDGTSLDGDRDAEDGGTLNSSFTTVSTTTVPNTTISGFVVDPGNDLKPMTVDDYSAGPDGADYTEDDVFKSPIEGATVFILGLEHIKVTTDENGYFELTEVPAGNVKIAVDGRTATNAPEGIFWPEMVMDANIVAGQANTMMAAMNTGQERDAVEGRGEVYLPRVSSEILQEVSDTEETEIGMPVSAAQDLTAEERSQVKLVIQPGSSVDEHGNPVEDPMVGISTVPPELVMDMLPAGLMQHTFDLTIQAPDSAVFITPAELTLPNVFDAAPGTKLNFLSFDHTTGRLVIEGTGTVSADGQTVTTDPGTGITKPGWHGVTPPGSPTTGPGNGYDPDNPIGNGGGDGGGIPGNGGSGGGNPPPVERPEIPQDASACIAELHSFSDGIYWQTIVEHNNFIKNVFSINQIKDRFENALERISDSKEILTQSLASWRERNLVDLFVSQTELAAAQLDSALEAIRIAEDFITVDRFDFIDAVSKSAEEQFSFFSDRLENLREACRDEPAAQSAISEAEKAVELFGGFNSAVQLTLDLYVKVRGLKNSSLGNQIIGLPEDIIEAIRKLKEEDPDNSEISRFFMGIGSVIVDRFDTVFGPATDAFIDLFPDVADFVGEIGNDAKSALDGLINFFRLPGASNIPHNDNIGVISGGEFILFSDGVSEFRSQLSSSGTVDIFLEESTLFTAEVFNLETGGVGSALFQTNESGVNSDIPQVFLSPDTSLDQDGDGLSEFAERVLGTDDTLADTDGDGLTDLSEMKRGSDPSSYTPFPSGLLTSISLERGINDIIINQEQGDVAYILTDAGISIVDLSVPNEPILVDEITTRLSLVDGTIAGPGGGLVTRAEGGEIGIWNLTARFEPQFSHWISQTSMAMAVSSAGVFVASENRVALVDARTGLEISTLLVPDIGSMAATDDAAYLLDLTGVLHIASVADGSLTITGSVDTMLGAGPRDMFAENGVVYLAGARSDRPTIPNTIFETFTGGFATFDVSDPVVPVLLSGIDNTALGGSFLAPSGSGFAVGAGTLGRLSPVVGLNPVVDILATSVAEVTDDSRSRFQLEAIASAVAVGGGLAYVGDISGRLLVLPPLGLEADSVAPIIEISRSPIDQDPMKSGIQVSEGSQIQLGASILGSTFLTSVELLQDGNRVGEAAVFPFEISTSAPLLSGTDGPNVEYQFRAIDSLGNIGVSETVTLELIADQKSPIIAAIAIEEAEVVLPGFLQIPVLFDEAFDPITSLEDVITLFGPDGSVVFNAPLQDPSNGVLVGRWDLQLEGIYTLRIDPGEMQDRAGNFWDGDVETISFDVVAEDVEWIKPEGGSWFDVTGWSTGELPDETSDVSIDLNDGARLNVTSAFTTEHAAAWRITLDGELRVASSESLTSNIEMEEDSKLVLQDGALLDSRVMGADTASVDVLSAANLSNTTIDVDANVVGQNIRFDGNIEFNSDVQLKYEHSGNVSFDISEDALIGGTGTLQLLGDDLDLLALRGSNSERIENFEFGTGMDVIGRGRIIPIGTDSVSLFGRVVADGGRLSIWNLDNAGGIFRASSINGGDIAFFGNTDLSEIEIAAGTNVSFMDGSYDDMTIRGDGVAQFITSGFGSDIQKLTVVGQVYGEDLTVTESLHVDGTLRSKNLQAEGQKMITGQGEIVLTGAIGSEETGGSFYFQGVDAGPETLVFGPDLTIAGNGFLGVRSDSGGDTIQVLGTLSGRDGGMIVGNLDNNGASVGVETSETDGYVIFTGSVSNVIFNPFNDPLARLEIGTGATYDSVVMNMRGRIGSPNASNSATFINGFELNAEIELGYHPGFSGWMIFLGSQTISGTGVIDLNGFAAAGYTANLWFDGSIEEKETLIVEQGMEISGSGSVTVLDAGDVLQVDGDLLANDGTLRVFGEVTGDGTLGARDDGNLNLEFDFNQSQTGTLEIGIDMVDGNVQHGFVQGNRSIALNGNVRLDVASGLTVDIGERFFVAYANDGFDLNVQNEIDFGISDDLKFDLVSVGENWLALDVVGV